MAGSLTPKEIKEAIRTIGRHKPLGDFVIVALDAPKETPGGIVLADVTRDKVSVGIVCAIGPDVTSVKVGDRVLFGLYDSVNKVTIDGKVDETFRIMRAHALQAVIVD